MHLRLALMPIVMAAALAGSLAADPIPTYVATSASLSYEFTTATTLENLSFAGPDLSLSGTGGAAGAPAGNIVPGVPFNFSPFVVYGDPTAIVSGNLGGVSGAFEAFSNSLLTAPGVVFNLPGGQVPPPLTNDIPPITAPATAAGTVSVCTPLGCSAGAPAGTNFQVTMDIPGMVTLQIVNFGSISNPMYMVSSAQFTTVPEPNTAMLLALAIGVSLCCIRLRRNQRA